MSLGSIVVRLSMNTADFDTDSKRAASLAKKRAAEIDRAFTAAGRAIGLALGAGLTIATVAIKNAIDRADELSKASQKIGITTEELSKLGYAAQLADVDLGTLQAGLGRLTKFQSDAAIGTERNIALFDALGVSFKNTDGTLRNTESVFRDFANIFQALPDGANKSALAIDVFGKSGANLIPLLNLGADGLEKMGDRAAMLGVVISTETGKAAEEFNDRLSDLGLQVQGLALAVAEDLLPDLNRLTGEFQNGTEAGNGFAATAENIANGIRGVALVAGKAYDTISLLALGIANVAAEMALFSAKYNANALLLGGNQDAITKLENIAAVTEAGAREAAQSLAGNGPESGNGMIQFIDPPEAKAQARAAEEVNAALEKYRGSADAAKAAASGLAAAKKAGAAADREAAASAKEAAKAASDARVAQLDQFLELVELREEERRLVAEDAQLKADAKAIVDQTLADIAFETKLLGLNNLEREKAIALRYANVDAASKEGQAISAALDEMDKTRQVAEGMDVVRDATRGLFSDLMDGSKSASEAFKDFVSNILDGIAQIVAKNLTEQLLGSFGSTGGGASGGGLAALFGSFFGGARADGGSMYAGKAYLVGERGPELVMPSSAGTVIPADRTAAMLGGRGASVTNNFMMPGRYDSRTQAQVAADSSRSIQRATSRSVA